MVTGEGALAKAERVKPSWAEGQSSSPKKDDVYMTVSPDFIPAFAAFPEADCSESKVSYSDSLNGYTRERPAHLDNKSSVGSLGSAQLKAQGFVDFDLHIPGTVCVTIMERHL